jgi:hypothetical protein
LPRDLDLLAAECAETRPELLVIDPFFAVLGVDENGRYIKANDDQSVRRLTSKLKKLAERSPIRPGTHCRISSAAVIRCDGNMSDFSNSLIFCSRVVLPRLLTICRRRVVLPRLRVGLTICRRRRTRYR